MRTTRGSFRECFAARGALGLGLLVALSASTPCVANPNIRKSFFNAYPAAVGTRLDSVGSAVGHCGVCHFNFKNGGDPWNPYGARIKLIGGLNSDNGRIAAIQAASNRDDDGDGFLGLTEISGSGYSNTPTFPGLTSANVNQATNVTISQLVSYVTPTVTVDTDPPTVVVTSPNGGESLTGNRASTVTWTASDTSGITAIHLYESLDNGLIFTPVAQSLPNTGFYAWTPANRPTTTARLQVMAVDGAGNTNTDTSDLPFTILSPPGGRVPTTLRDFDMPGSQPFEGGPEATSPTECATCHSDYGEPGAEPYRNWQGSMMAHASRDPLFEANMVIANQDAPDSGDLCLRCHDSRGWLQGRSVPTNGDRILHEDKMGVSCDLCHRMVDPVYQAGVSPVRDSQVLAVLRFPGNQYGNGMFVVDPSGIQRGPFADAAAPHQFIESSFHRGSALCGTCHDVSNPAFTKDANGIYQPNAFNTPSDNFSPHSAGPVERTYSEWVNSEYNTPAGVYQPEFAGNKPDGRVSSCQDCHMRDVQGHGCNLAEAPLRPNLPLHDMTGGSTWVPNLIANIYPAEVNAAAIQEGIVRATSMLQNAADLTVNIQGGKLVARVTNQTGHKLPTGYPEGRRIWVNVKFFNTANELVSESGAYNPQTGVLSHDAEAKIYEVHPGIGENISNVVGLAAGPSLHFVLNNKIYEDNRIPPRGFSNAAFASFGGAPVGHAYADGQHWDDSAYTIPAGATRAEARLFYQSTSKEFIEFLRDENKTNNKGLEMYNLWNENGKCPPVLMAQGAWAAPQLEFAGLVGATAGVESAALSWPAATGGCPPVTYHVYQATTSGGQDFGTPVMSTGSVGAVVTPLDAGATSHQSYYFVVRATDGCGGNETNTLEMAAQPLLDAAKDQDRDGMGNGTEQQYGMNPFDSADALLDADHDGMANMVESALGSNPSDAGDAHWPVAAAVEAEGSRHLAIRYIRRKNDTAASIVVEISGDLETWQSGPAHTTVHAVTDNADGSETVVERVNEPMDQATGGFMRLKIFPK